MCRLLIVLPMVLFIVTGCRSLSTTTRSPAELLAARTNYPAHWWTAVPTNGAPSWEILPQAAGPGEVILSKRNELGLLSNFAATPFTFRGKRYASLEGFWQMMKFPETSDMNTVAQAFQPAGSGDFPVARDGTGKFLEPADKNVRATMSVDPRAKFPGLTWSYTREQVAQMIAFEAKRAGDLGSENMKRMGITWVTFEGKQMEYRAPEHGEFFDLIVAATWEKVRQNPDVKKVLIATGGLVLKPDHHQEPNAPAAWRYYEILTQIRRGLQRQR